jgi:hypothetical protein
VARRLLATGAAACRSWKTAQDRASVSA